MALRTSLAATAADVAAVSMQRRRFLGAGAGALTLGMMRAPAFAQGAQKVRFTLDWAVEGPSAPFFVAMERGYMSDAKLSVVYEPGKGSAGAIAAVADGRQDMGVADLSALIEFKGRKPAAAVQAVYVVFNATPASIITLRRSDYALEKRFGIQNLNDLRGKKLGAPGFDAARKMWPMLARANNIDPQEVSWMDVTPQRRESELMLGTFDAISGFHYTSTLNLLARGSKANDIVTFRFLDYGVPLYGNALIVNTEFAAREPQAVRAFVRAFNRGLRETVADPRKALDHVLAVSPGMSMEAESQRLNLCLEHNVLTKDVKTNGYGGVSVARLQRSVDDLVATFQLPNKPSVESVFSDKYLPAQAERAV